MQEPPGNYQVSIPAQFQTTDGDGVIYVSGAGDNIQNQNLSLGGSATATFSTTYTPDLTVNIGGPASGFAGVENQDANGETVTIQPLDSSDQPTGTPTTCTTAHGTFGEGAFPGSPASCSMQEPPGNYQVSIPAQFQTTDGDGVIYVSGAGDNIQNQNLSLGGSATRDLLHHLHPRPDGQYRWSGVRVCWGREPGCKR